jgi:hypothetical protein
MVQLPGFSDPVGKFALAALFFGVSSSLHGYGKLTVDKGEVAATKSRLCGN